MKRVVLLVLVVFFFPSHVVDLLSNLNELFDDSQGQYNTEFLVMMMKEDGKWKVFGFEEYNYTTLKYNNNINL